jgi:hypothetical protein
MKIIRSAKNKKPKETTAECSCGCKFHFAASEARYVSDQRDGDAYVVKCPECSRENWIDARFFN